MGDKQWKQCVVEKWQKVSKNKKTSLVSFFGNFLHI